MLLVGRDLGAQWHWLAGRGLAGCAAAAAAAAGDGLDGRPAGRDDGRRRRLRAGRRRCKQEDETGEKMEALFADKEDTSLADGFRDKVRALHEHFDRDKDGFLDHSELRGLQLLTSGNDMSQGQYVLVCKSLACDPNKGLCGKSSAVKHKTTKIVSQPAMLM